MITLFSVAVHLLFKSKSSTCHLDPLLWPSEAEASLTCMIHKLQLGCINVCSDVCEAFEDSRCYWLLLKHSFRRSVIRSCEGLSAGDGSGHSPAVMSLNTCVRALLQPLQSWCVYRTSDNPASMDRSQTVFSLGHRSSDVHTESQSEETLC